MMLYCAGASSHRGVRPPGNIAGNENPAWARPSTASIQSLAGQDCPSGILCAGPQPQEEGSSNNPYGPCDAPRGQTDAQLRDFAFAPEEVTFLETVLRRKSDDGSSNQQLAQYGYTNAATAPVAPPFGGYCFERQIPPGFTSSTMPPQNTQNTLGGNTAVTTTATAVSPFGSYAPPFPTPGYEPSLRLANSVSAPITVTNSTAALPSNDQTRPQTNVGRSASSADGCLRLLRPPPFRIYNSHRDSFLPPTPQQHWPANAPGWISCPSSATFGAAAPVPLPPPPPAAAAAAATNAPWPWTAGQVQSPWPQLQPQQQQQQLQVLPAQHPAIHHPRSLLRSQSQRPFLLPPPPPAAIATATDDAMLDEMLLAEIEAAPWPTTNLRQCSVNGCICTSDGAHGGMSAATVTAPPLAPSPAASEIMRTQMPSTGTAVTSSMAAATAPMPALPVPTQPTGAAPASFNDPFVWPPNTSAAGPTFMVCGNPPVCNTQGGNLASQHPAAGAPIAQPQRLGAPCALPQLTPAPGATGVLSPNTNEADLAAARGSASATGTASQCPDLGSLPQVWYASPQQQLAQIKLDTHSQPPSVVDPRVQDPQLGAQEPNPRSIQAIARPAGRRPSQPLRGAGPFAVFPQVPQPPSAAHLHRAGSVDRSSADTQTRLEGGASAGGGDGGGAAAAGTATSLASDAGGVIAGTALAARSGRSRQSLTLEALRAMFELPAQDVVVALGISATDLKRRCRALGIRRWPHRKLASLKRLAEAIEADDEIGHEEQQIVLERVATNRAKIFADPDAEFDPGLKSLRQVQYKRHFVERQHGGGL